MFLIFRVSISQANTIGPATAVAGSFVKVAHAILALWSYTRIPLQTLDCRASCRVWFGVAARSIFCHAVPCSSPNQTCGLAFSETFQPSWCWACPVRASRLHNVCWNSLHPSMTKFSGFISHLLERYFVCYSFRTDVRRAIALALCSGQFTQWRS